MSLQHFGVEFTPRRKADRPWIEETFWKLVDKTRIASGGDFKKQRNLLIEELILLSVDEILALESVMYNLMDNAYHADLWDAASIINCGCGDDGFEDFRAWLIAQGKDVYEKALVDPESLVNLIKTNERARDEDFLYVSMIAHERKTGQVLPARADKERPRLRGVHWSQEIRKERFPKLAAKFGDCDQRESIWDVGDIEPDEF